MDTCGDCLNSDGNYRDSSNVKINKMKRIYDQYKDKEITIKGYTGKLAGYNDDKFILAVLKPYPREAFRKLDAGSYVSPDFSDKMYNYLYVNESDFIGRQEGLWKV